MNTNFIFWYIYLVFNFNIFLINNLVPYLNIFDSYFLKLKKNIIEFAFGVAKPPPRVMGVASATLDWPLGVVELPPWPLVMAEPPPMAKMGWLFFIYYYFLKILNNILLLFLISGIRVPFVTLEFSRRNSIHELNILRSILDRRRSRSLNTTIKN